MPLDLKFTVKYRVPTRIIYEALTTPEIMMKFTQCPVKFENNFGGSFSLYNDYITGTNQELVPNTKIVQKWKQGNWKEFADLTITFKETSGNESALLIILKGIPERDTCNQYVDTKQVEAGWRSQIFQKINDYLGYPLNKDADEDSD